MESDYKSLLYHTDVRWLSKCKVLARVVFLRTEILSFLEVESEEFKFIEDNIWWLKVTFLNDLFENLNNPNLSLQGAKENIITISCKLQAFKEKLDVWIKNAENKKFDLLPGVNASSVKD